MKKQKITKEKIFKDFLKIKKAVKHFPTVQELKAFAGGNVLYGYIRQLWGRYSGFQATMFPEEQTGKASKDLMLMVVSPDKGVREYIVWFLTKRGHFAIEVTGAKEASQKLSDQHHVLVILDKNIEEEASSFINMLNSKGGQVIMFEMPFHSESLEAQVIRAIQKWPRQKIS